MAFAQFNPADVPSAIQSITDFLASNMGWTTSFNAGTGTVDIPGKPATFTLTSNTHLNSTRGLDFESLRVDVTGVTTPWGTECNALKPISKMWLFAGSTPEPWVHVVFETVPTYFHHVYFGYVEKYGNYTGGAVADGTGWNYTSSPQPWNDRSNNGLFSGGNGVIDYIREPGGVEIEHADAPASCYRFVTDYYKASTYPYRAGGGFGDGYNGSLCWAPSTGLENNAILHPVILFADINNDEWVTPIACVPGVRFVNIMDFVDGQLVDAGNQNWRLFPLCRRDPNYLVLGPGATGDATSGQFNINGYTSNIGIAVLEE